MEFLHYAEGGFVLTRMHPLRVYSVPVVDLFRSCDLDLDPMTFTYELDLYYLEMQRMCRYELHTSRLSKVIV